MEENNHNDESVKLRGRVAISVHHQNISDAKEERKLNNKISKIYDVDSDEAIDIHVNYHLDRISAFLLRRASKNGMPESMFFNRLNSLNAVGYAYSVAQGELLEMAAVDILYKRLCNLHNQDPTTDDRYINFYG